MKYIQSTRDITLTMEADDGPKWWVDSSYAVHPDMRSHSGIYMTLGKGTAYSMSSKQKLNTKSTTEAELVAMDNSKKWGKCCGPDTSSWRRLSTCLLQQSTRITRVQSYWQKMGRHQVAREPGILILDTFCDRQNKKGVVNVAYCPTQDILGNFFTKPLQGAQFAWMKSKILNLPSSSSTDVHRRVFEQSKKSAGSPGTINLIQD